MNCYLVLKSKLRLNSYSQGTVKWILMQSIIDGWKKWKETMQLYPTAVINGKANNQKDIVLFFIISEKWTGPFGFWTLLCHFLGKDDFRYVRMENLHNAILLMPVFHKLHCWSYVFPTIHWLSSWLCYLQYCFLMCWCCLLTYMLIHFFCQNIIDSVFFCLFLLLVKDSSYVQRQNINK